MHRRSLLGLLAASPLALGAFWLGGCRREPRCSSCGMVLDPGSRWYTEVEEGGVRLGFDTPKCGLRHLLAHPGGKLYAHGYYRQGRLADDQLVFAIGSDILGPMGTDLVPVEPEFGPKFQTEHHASELLPRARLTAEIVAAQ